MSGRRDRLQAALLQRVADDLRDQVVRHLIQDLVAVPLLDDGRGHLAWTESRHGFAAVALRHAVDLGVQDLGRDFEGQVLPGLGDLGELGLHCSILFGAAGQMERPVFRPAGL